MHHGRTVTTSAIPFIHSTVCKRIERLIGPFGILHQIRLPLFTSFLDLEYYCRI